MSSRGVTKTGQSVFESCGDRIGWDDLKYFLAVAEHGSQRAAAAALGTTVTTVGRRLEELESAIGEALVERSRQGGKLTPLGHEILEEVRKIALLVGAVGDKAENAGKAIAGRVSIGVTEGLATYWIGPRLVEFQERFPLVMVDLISTMGFVDIARQEADMAIQLKPPSDPDLTTVRLGKLHLCFFMSEAYRRRHGTPQSLKDLKSHRLIIQSANQLDTQILLDAAGVDRPEGVVAFASNTSSIHYMLIAKGAGIGILPTYANALGADLIPVDLGVRHAYDIWLTFHKDARRFRAKGEVIDWLKACFDATHFPWFAESYQDPESLARLPNAGWQINMLPPLRSND